MRLARVLQLNQRLTAGGDSDQITDELQPLLEGMQRDLDDRGLVRAYGLAARLPGRKGHFREAMPSLEEAASLAARAGDDYDFASSQLILTYVLLEGTTPVAEALDRTAAIVEHPRLGRQMRLRIRAITAVLHALAGNRTEANAILNDIEVLFASPGFWGAEAPRMAALAAIVLGDLDAAEGYLSYSVEQFEDPLLRLDGGGLFAYLLALQGLSTEAIEASEFAESLIPRRNIDDQSLWRLARALAFARLERYDEAEKLAREAVDLTLPTDGLRWQGNALFGLAQILAAAARPGAKEAAVEARHRYEEKGAGTLVDSVQFFLDSR
jgi:tetratricopeptide (TPR) repeat protein